MALWLPLDLEAGEERRPLVPVSLRLEENSPAGLPQWQPLPLILDTGSDVCIVPIEWVTEYGLAMNILDRNVRSYGTSSGGLGYGFRGNLQVQLDGDGFSWPCLFSLPPGVAEHQADELLQDLFLQQMPSAPRVSSAPRSKTRSVEDWMKKSLPEIALRPALLGRRGFLQDFEVLICADYVRILRRRRWRDRRRAAVRSCLRFLRRES